jgi:hypothetical protein
MRSGSSDNYVHYLLAELACAAIRTRLLSAEIDSIGVALRGAIITPDGAMEWMADIGALGLIPASSAITTLAST